MRGTAVLTFIFLLSAAATAGCLASDPSEGSSTPEADPAPSASNNTTEVEVYSFSGEVTGADPPHPTETGPVTGQQQAAKTDTFRLEMEADLSFDDANMCGTQYGRIEVTDPDGETVFASDRWIFAGAPGGPCGGLINTVGESADGPHPAGEYTVRYHVAGATSASLVVTAVQGATGS